VNAQHAFMRDEGHRYDPPLASLVYRLSLDLFARAL
jgi:carboxymethylenebutenolidase